MGIGDVSGRMRSGEAADRARYLELLRLNSSAEADKAELTTLARKLGKTAEQVSLDFSFVRQFDAHAAKISSGLKAAAESARAAAREYHEQTAPAAVEALKAQQQAAMDQLLADQRTAHESLLATFNAAH